MSRVPSLGPRGEGWVVLQILLIGLTGLGALLGRWPTGRVAAVTSLVGAVTMGIGAALVVRGVLDLGSAVTPLPKPREGAPLVTNGVYGIVRHPIYSGVVLLAAGGGLLSGSPVTLLGSVALFVLFDLKARREEAWLIERYPEYEAYRRRTRKLMPGIY